MEQPPRNRHAETEVVLVAEFEHPPNGFLSARRFGRWSVPGIRQGLVLDDDLEIFLQVHASGMRLCEKASFDFGLECQGNGHGILPAVPV